MMERKTIAGYCFNDASLLEEALTHPSVENTAHYQRLEFLGDRVLGLVIAAWLLETFPAENEGQLNLRLASIVRGKALAKVAVEMGLDQDIRVSKSAEAEGVRKQQNVLADICESVIGAIYLDGGFDAVQDFIKRHFSGYLKRSPVVEKDSKTALQEIAQAQGLSLPNYQVIERTGPDHAPRFTISVSVDGLGAASASGASKREAEQRAAAVMIESLEGNI